MNLLLHSEIARLDYVVTSCIFCETRLPEQVVMNLLLHSEIARLDYVLTVTDRDPLCLLFIESNLSSRLWTLREGTNELSEKRMHPRPASRIPTQTDTQTRPRYLYLTLNRIPAQHVLSKCKVAKIDTFWRRASDLNYDVFPNNDHCVLTENKRKENYPEKE